MTTSELEEAKIELLVKLRKLLKERTDKQLLWSERQIPTPQKERDSLNCKINDVKLELTQIEAELKADSFDRKDSLFSALAEICESNGKSEWVKQAERECDK